MLLLSMPVSVSPQVNRGSADATPSALLPVDQRAAPQKQRQSRMRDLVDSVARAAGTWALPLALVLPPLAVGLYHWRRPANAVERRARYEIEARKKAAESPDASYEVWLCYYVRMSFSHPLRPSAPLPALCPTTLLFCGGSFTA